MMVSAVACDTAPGTGDVTEVRQPLTGFTFGVTNQQSFQNNYLPTLGYSNENSQEFGNRFAEQNTWNWWYNLSFAAPFWENSNDQDWGGNDSVSLVYSYTHGFVSGTGSGSMSGWNMNEQVTWASSLNMRLGDEATQLGVWASWACHVLYTGDGYFITRWWNAFAGGLYTILGSQDIVYDGWTTSDTGEQLAENLNDGDVINHAWTDAMGDWWVSNDVSVAMTGSNYTDCYWRLDNAHWPGVMSFGRYRDGSIGYFCAYEWTDL